MSHISVKFSLKLYYFFSGNNDLVSGGEDGLVNIWDLREKQPVNKVKPYEHSKIARPDLGKWIGAVDLNEDWLVIITIKKKKTVVASFCCSCAVEDHDCHYGISVH